MKVGQRFNPHRMFTCIFVPEAVYLYPGLSALAKLIYGRLCRYKGERGDAYPAALTLAKELDISERQVFEHLSRLEEARLIEREPRPGTSTVYHLIWHECFEYPDDLGSAENRTTGEHLTCGEPHGGSAENRTTGSAENRRRRESIEESQGRDTNHPSPPPAKLPTPSTTLDTGELDPETGEEFPRQQPYKKNWKRPKAEKPHAKSDRLRQIREASHGGEGVTAPIRREYTPEKQTSNGYTPPPDGFETKPIFPDEADLWNQIVTHGTRVEAFDWFMAEGNDLRRCREHAKFTSESWRTACQKAERALATGECGWITFRWLLKNDNNWWKVLNGEYDNYKPAKRDKKSDFNDMIAREREENDELVAAIKRKRSLGQGTTAPTGVPSGVPCHTEGS